MSASLIRWIALFCAVLGVGAAAAPATPPVKEWTFLLYLAGDERGFKPFNDAFLKRLEHVRSLTADSPVQIILMYDDAGKDPGYRYRLLYQPSPTSRPGPDTPPLTEAEVQAFDPGFHYGELNSANAVTLKHFVEWGVRAFPARHYGLILSGHSYGIYGMLQDFHLPVKQKLEQPSMMRNYEIRRALEEAYRSLGPSLPERKIDLLLIDSCLTGQLDVMLEYRQLFDYIAASTMETPDSGLPYEDFLEPFIQAVKRGSAPAHQTLEESFLKPFTAEFVKSHSRGGSLANEGKQIDAVEAFALRTAALAPLADALKAFTQSMPGDFYDDWEKGLPNTEAATDANGNIDLLEMKTRLSDYLKVRVQEARDPKWQAPLDRLEALDQAIGYRVKDPLQGRTKIDHPSATGAWVHLQVDEITPVPELAACVGLSSFVVLNDRPENQDLLPRFTDITGEELPASYFDCNAIAHKQIDPDEIGIIPGQGIPVRLDTVFKRKVQFPHGVPAYLTDVPSGSGLTRWLSIWIPRAKGAATLSRNLVLRVPAAANAQIDYLGGSPEDFMLGKIHGLNRQSLRFEPYFVANGPSQLGPLYVSEAHSSGVPFRRGLGILLMDDLPGLNEYKGGRVPIEQVEKAPYAMTLESYFADLEKAGTMEKESILGKTFYRAHRISTTRWPDFLFDGE